MTWTKMQRKQRASTFSLTISRTTTAGERTTHTRATVSTMKANMTNSHSIKGESLKDASMLVTGKPDAVCQLLSCRTMTRMAWQISWDRAAGVYGGIDTTKTKMTWTWAMIS